LTGNPEVARQISSDIRVLLQVSIGIAFASLEAATSRPVDHSRTKRFVEFSHPAFIGFTGSEIHDAHPARDGI
jgi:hypothetical protein